MNWVFPAAIGKNRLFLYTRTQTLDNLFSLSIPISQVISLSFVTLDISHMIAILKLFFSACKHSGIKNSGASTLSPFVYLIGTSKCSLPQTKLLFSVSEPPLPTVFLISLVATLLFSLNSSVSKSCSFGFLCFPPNGILLIASKRNF